MSAPRPPDSALPGLPDALFSEAEVQAAVDRIAARLAERDPRRRLTLVTVLEGGRWLAERLTPRLERAGRIERVAEARVRRTVVDGVLGPPRIDPVFRSQVLPSLAGAHVLFVDDIHDEGETLYALTSLTEPVAATVQTAVLVTRDRPDRAREPPTFAALKTSSKGWLVGCGMDSAGRYRDLPYIGVVGREPR